MRSRTLIILLLLPVIIVLWALGWSLYSIGDQQTTRKYVPKKEQETVQVIANVLEEEEIPQ
jgi:hypothetical protein